jgi:hypothetical protein
MRLSYIGICVYVCILCRYRRVWFAVVVCRLSCPGLLSVLGCRMLACRVVVCCVFFLVCRMLACRVVVCRVGFVVACRVVGCRGQCCRLSLTARCTFQFKFFECSGADF